MIQHCLRARCIQIGRLGEIHTQKGYYIYIGSAFGPGGVRARVNRHLRITDFRHWHIDYLRPFVQILEVWYSHDQVRREHQWAEIFGLTPGLDIPLNGFGASDCRCPAHLFFAEVPFSLEIFRSRICRAFPRHDLLEKYEVGDKYEL
ncbi:MAG: DUF123 domain-containing protein [bacterium]